MYLLQNYTEKNYTESILATAYWIFYETIKSIMNDSDVNFLQAIKFFYRKEMSYWPFEDNLSALKEKIIGYIENELFLKEYWWWYYCPQISVKVIKSTINSNEILDKIAKLQEMEE